MNREWMIGYNWGKKDWERFGNETECPVNYGSLKWDGWQYAIKECRDAA